MAYRINSAPSQLTTLKTPKPTDHPPYLRWLRTLPCVVTLSKPVEAAHLSTGDEAYGHPGRAKGRRAGDRWALPLTPEQHRKQHSGNEITYWTKQGIVPYVIAHELWAIYHDFDDKEDARMKATSLINRRLIGRGLI